jgi:hypothetical protein
VWRAGSHPRPQAQPKAEPGAKKVLKNVAQAGPCRIGFFCWIL